MEYNSEGYGSTVDKPKRKNYKIPIIIVIIIAIIAVIVIYYATTAAKTVSLEGDSPTTANLSGYVDDISDRFYVDAQSLTLYKDSTAQVENGNITSLEVHMAMQYGTVEEYWQIKDDDSGIKMTYKGQLEGSQGCYTLSQLCAYLENIDGILNNGLSSPSYTVQFSAALESIVQAGGYIWNGEAFELLLADEAAGCYPITVTAGDAQYFFYAV